MGFALHEAATLAEATALARTLGPDACFIAGGTDLVIQMKRRVRAPRALIDLSRIPDLAAIGKHGDVYTIGALTTHKTIESFPDFRAGPLAALREAARVIGGHQIRNRGTIGGNLANASPAADLAPPLLTLDALVVLRGPDGSRRIPLDEFLVGPRATLRAHDEAIEAVQFADLPPHSATAFLKAGRRKAMEISVVSVAAHLTLDPAGERCRVARIAIGSAAPTAVRARAAEALLEGSALDDARLDRVGQAALDAVAPLDDVRSSSEYRRLLVEVLVPRALRLCASRIADQAQ